MQFGRTPLENGGIISRGHQTISNLIRFSIPGLTSRDITDGGDIASDTTNDCNPLIVDFGGGYLVNHSPAS
jgi:hypothetical protein